MIVFSVCLPSDALSQHLPSYLGFSYLAHSVSLHGCSSKVQLLLLTLDEGYLLTATPPDLEDGVAPLRGLQKALTFDHSLWSNEDSPHSPLLAVLFLLLILRGLSQGPSLTFCTDQTFPRECLPAWDCFRAGIR